MMKSVWTAGLAVAALTTTAVFADPPANAGHRHGATTGQAQACQHGANHAHGMRGHGGAHYRGTMAQPMVHMTAMGGHGRQGEHGMGHGMHHGHAGAGCPMQESPKAS